MHDEVTQALIECHELRGETHLDRARPREVDQAVVDDAAGPRTHDANPACEIPGFAQVMGKQVMGNEQNCWSMRGPEFLHFRPQLLACDLIECTERFIE